MLHQLVSHHRDRDRQSEHRKGNLEYDERGPYPPDLHVRAAAPDAAQCRLHPRPGSAERGQQSDDRGSPDRDQPRVEHGGQAEGDIPPERPVHVRREVGPRVLHEALREHDPHGRGHEAQHERLDEQLPHHAHTRRAERIAHYDLRLAQRRACEHQRGDVRARDEEHHPDEQVGSDEHTERLFGRRIREHARPQVLVRRRIPLRHARADRPKLGLRSLQRNTLAQPPEHANRRPGERLRLREPQRRPDVMVDRKQKPLRHHAHHRDGDSAELHGAADDGWIRIEAAAPQVVANHDHVLGPGRCVRFHQRPPEQWRHARERECDRADLRHLDRLGAPVCGDQVALDRAIGTELLDRSELVAPFQEVLHGARLDTARRHVVVLEPHDPLTLGERQRRVTHLPRELEEPGTERHRRRERHSTDDRQAGILEQHAPAQLPVEPRGAELAETRAGALVTR